MSSIEWRACGWIIGRDSSSSKAIWAVMMGHKSDGSYPHDGADLGRCLRLLDAVPEWKPRINEMAAVNDYWAALVPRWDELATLYAKDEGRGVYQRIREILEPIEDKDPRVFRFKSGNGSIRVGNP